MHLPTLFTSAVLALSTLTAAAKPGPPKNPISDHIIVLSHRTIASKRSFEDTRAALEAAVPPLNWTFSALLQQGRTAEALEALKELPTLSSFVVPPRNFGGLVTVQGITGKKVLQYEIGNPYTASKMVRYHDGVSLYAPIRVSLMEDDEGVAKFIFDRPITLFGQFKDKRIDATAEVLDNVLKQVLLFAGGWPSTWPIPALP